MSSTSAVWVPSNLTEAGQMILAVPASPTQKMDRFLLQIAVANKISRLAQDLTDEEMREVLQGDPDLSAAIGPLTEKRPMAEAALAADNLNALIMEANLSSKPTRNPKALQLLEAQTLPQWVGNLQRASEEN